MQLYIIIVIIIMGLRLVSALKDVIGDPIIENYNKKPIYRMGQKK